MSDLDKLIEAVEGGSAYHSDFASMFPYPICDHAREAQSGSLDAARALHESLLDSGFHAEVWACCTRPRVKVVRGEEVYDGREQVTEARSWLIAILKAYRSNKVNKILSIKEVCGVKPTPSSRYPYDGYEVITEEGVLRFLIESGQNCCEDWGYMTSEDDTQSFVGASLLSVRFVDESLNVSVLKNLQDSWIDQGSCCFVNLETTVGTLQFVIYNEHNGYYSHSVYLQTLSETDVMYL